MTQKTSLALTDSLRMRDTAGLNQQPAPSFPLPPVDNHLLSTWSSTFLLTQCALHGRRRVSSGFEIKNGRVHRLGRPHGIEIFAEERDLAACCPQEHDILLAIESRCRFDPRLR